MRVLVTGGAGFIGSHLVDSLLKDQYEVIVIDNFDPFYDRGLKEHNIYQHFEFSSYRLVEADIRDRDSVLHIFKENKPDIVVHLAARTGTGIGLSLEDPPGYVEVNINGTVHLLDAAVKHGVQRFVFASSSSVYGLNEQVPFSGIDPIFMQVSPYGATKVSGEALCRSYSHCYQLPVIVLRFFTVYGPRQRPDLVIHKFAKKMMNNETIQIFGDGMTFRDYTYVDDIIAGIRASIDYKHDGYEVFDLGNDRPTRLIDLVKNLEQILERDARIEWQAGQVDGLPGTWANIYHAKARLGYEPRMNMKTGLQLFTNWMKENRELNNINHRRNQFVNIPFSPPDISDTEIDEVIRTLKSGWITTGPKTKLFETKIAEYSGTSKVACLNSATAAMELTLRLLGIGPGDEIITSAYTYTASASVIDHVGAKIVLVDTGVNSYEMDYEQLEKAITPHTKVIIPVDIAGVMCDYDKIYEIIIRNKQLFHPSSELQMAFGRIVILADAAHSFGATYKGRRSGEVADFTSFSFHAVKNLTTGEGGAVTWRDIPGVENEEIYKQYMFLSLHGQSRDALAKATPGAWEYDIVSPAYKCNMTDIMASLGLGQLKRYPDMLSRRKQMIRMYNQALNGCDVEYLQHDGDHFSSSGHLYLVRLNGKDEAYRNRMIRKLAGYGIATNVHYKPLPMHSAYKNMGMDMKDFPNAFNMYQNEITLPLHTLLTDEQVEYIINSLKTSLGITEGLYDPGRIKNVGVYV